MRRLVATVALGISALGIVGSLAGAASAASTATLPSGVEAWYEVAGCSVAAVGCGLVAPPTDPFAADTLHVGATAGMATTESFITLNTSAVPAGQVLTAGTLTLPLATDPQAGTANPGSGQLVACLATELFVSAEFVTSTPPTMDCTVTAPGVYDATSDSVSVDLAPFIAKAKGNLTGVGIALIPDPTDSLGTYQLAFNGHERMQTGESDISAAVTYASAPTVTSSTQAAPSSAPDASPVVRQSVAPARPTVRTTAKTSVVPAAAVPLPSSVAPAPAGPVSAGSVSVTAPEAAAAGGVSAVQDPVVAADAPDAQVAAGPVTIAPNSRIALAAHVIPGGQYGLVWAVPLGLLALGYLVFSSVMREHKLSTPPTN